MINEKPLPGRYPLLCYSIYHDEIQTNNETNLDLIGHEVKGLLDWMRQRQRLQLLPLLQQQPPPNENLNDDDDDDVPDADDD